MIPSVRIPSNMMRDVTTNNTLRRETLSDAYFVEIIFVDSDLIVMLCHHSRDSLCLCSLEAGVKEELTRSWNKNLINYMSAAIITGQR